MEQKADPLQHASYIAEWFLCIETGIKDWNVCYSAKLIYKESGDLLCLLLCESNHTTRKLQKSYRGIWKLALLL